MGIDGQWLHCFGVGGRNGSCTFRCRLLIQQASAAPMARRVEKLVRKFTRGSTYWVEYILHDEDLEYFVDHLPGVHGRIVPHRDRRGHVRISLKTENAKVADKACRSIELVLEKAKESRGNQQVIGNVIRHLEQVLLKDGSHKPVTVAEFFEARTEEEKLRIDADKRGHRKPLSADSAESYQYYRALFLEFLRGKFGGREPFVDNVTVELATKFLDHLSGQKYELQTIGAIRGHLSGIWKKAIKLKHCDKSPWADEDTQVPAARKEAKPIFSGEQVRPVLGLPNDVDSNALIFMCCTGCRPSDTVGIQRTDVKGDLEYIETPQSKVGRAKPCIITPELRPIIDRQLKLHNSLFLFPRWNRKEKRWVQAGRKYASKRWNRRLKKLLGQNVYNKMFRYTFRTVLDQAGVSSAIADDLMGHIDPAIGQKHYIHHQMSTLRAAAQKVIPMITGHQDKTGEEKKEAAGD